MKVTLNRVNENFHFELKNDRGHLVNVDARPEFGGNDMGPSPMELVLMGVAGCSGIDMISILKKQRQQITSFKAEVEGERVQVGEAKPFKDIHVVFYLEGEIIPKKQLVQHNFLLRNIVLFPKHWNQPQPFITKWF